MKEHKIAKKKDQETRLHAHLFTVAWGSMNTHKLVKTFHTTKETEIHAKLRLQLEKNVAITDK